jgi:hypothetical protein
MKSGMEQLRGRVLTACVTALLLIAASACETGDFEGWVLQDQDQDGLPDLPGDSPEWDPTDDTVPDPLEDPLLDPVADTVPDPAADMPDVTDVTDVPVEEVPPNCYSEPVDTSAGLADLEAAYNGYNYMETMLETLRRRWPAGHDLFVAMEGDPYLGSYTDTSSFTTVMESLMTEVHEATHGWDYGHASSGSTFAYYLRADLTFHPPWENGFPRSEIRSMLVDDSTSIYESYLTGTQGTYGFVELLDELNAYINGMAGIAVVGEYEEASGYGISAIDGAVALFYYLELYLKRARTVYPDLYARTSTDPQFVDLVRTQWLRLHFFLAIADRFPSLGIHDGPIRTHLDNPENMQEISLFIGQEVSASSCL